MRLSCSEIEQLALKTMFLVGRTHMTGGPRWTVNRLAGEIGLPGIAIAQIGGTLEKAGLLIVTEDDEFVPGRDIGRITVQEILDVARNQRSGHSAARGLQIPAVERLSDNLEKAWRDVRSGRTLARPAREECSARKPSAAGRLTRPRASSPTATLSLVRIAPRRSTSVPSATMSRYICFRFPAIVISCTGYASAPFSTQ